MDFRADEIRDAGYRAVDLLSAIFNGPPDARVAPRSTRSGIRDAFAGSLTDDGVGLERTMQDVEQVVVPNSMRTPHPLYLGLVNTSPLPGAVLGDLVVSMLNNNGGAFHQGPAMWAGEQEVLDAFAAMIGGTDLTGMFLPGGSYANLHGLLVARTKMFPEWVAHGPGALTGSPVMYTSDVSHFSCQRAATVIGLGREGVAAIPTTGRGAMDVDALRRQIAHDREHGRRPFAVMATLGTTGTGAIDPLADLADVCAQEGIWFHVDACYGGGVLLLPEFAAHVRGIERADSVVIDPHKWFYMPMTAAMIFTRHPDVEVDTFDVDASYIPNDGEVDTFRRSITTSRRCAGFMAWMGLRAHGWNTIRDAVRRNIELTRLIESQLAARGFNVLPDGELSMACARWEPPGVTDPVALDDLQTRIAHAVVERGTAWFATVRHDGRTWMRFNVLNLHTREPHIETLVEALADVARGQEQTPVP